MKRYIHDGLGLRVMRGQANVIGAFDDRGDWTGPCGFIRCSGTGACGGPDPEPEPDLPPGWLPGIGGYLHVTGAEVQRRGGKWAWFPPNIDICCQDKYAESLELAMLKAVPRWELIQSYDGKSVFLKGNLAVFTDSKDMSWWQHNQDPGAFFPTPEAAMLAAERV